MDSFYVLHVADQDDLEDVEEGGAGGLASKMTNKVSDAWLRQGRRCGGRGTRRSGPRSRGHRPKLFAVPHAGIRPASSR